MPSVFSIRDWNDHFECSQSRKVTGPLTWVAMPTKHDGKVFRKIMTRTDGLIVFAAWCLIVEVAAKCPIRGRLADADGPLTAADLNLKTGCPTEAFETALNVLSSNDFGWLQVGEWEPTGSVLPPQDRTGQDKESASADSTAELGRNGQASAATEFIFPCVGRGPQEWTLTKAKLAEYVAAYPGLDIKAECRKARQWTVDNARKRKTHAGMAAFLTNWFNRAQNRGGGKLSGADEAYRLVTPEEFKAFVDTKKFKEGPTRTVSNKSWVYGTLRDGSKVECKTYPAPTA